MQVTLIDNREEKVFLLLRFLCLVKRKGVGRKKAKDKIEYEKYNDRTMSKIDLATQKLLKWEMRQSRCRRYYENNENGTGHD